MSSPFVHIIWGGDGAQLLERPVQHATVTGPLPSLMRDFSPSHLVVLAQPQCAVASIHIKNPPNWQLYIVWTQENTAHARVTLRHSVATGVAGKLKTVP